MARVRRPLAALAAVGACLAGSLATAQPAPAVPSRHGYAATVRAYWTADRMAAAVPLDGLIGSRTTRTAGRATTSNTLQSGTGGVTVPRTVGKLFFTDNNSDYVCSASAIVTRSRNQVLTAGHCVHTGPHPDGGLLGGLFVQPHYFSNWMYVPRYAGGRAPLGKWVATHAYVSSGWTLHENFSQDQAILTMGVRNHRNLIPVTGGNRITVGARPFQVGARIWGYPAVNPFTGETAWRCDGTTHSTSVDWPNDASMSCGMNGGASGGPWLLRSGRTAETGTIFAVTSRESTSGPPVLLAHPLTSSIRTLITRANG